MKHYLVRFGHREGESVSIGETELPTAIRAQITGKIGIFEEGTVSGNAILSITPDYNRMMGWNRDYRLSPEDWKEVGASVECKNARLALESSVRALKEQVAQKRLGNHTS